MSHIRPYVPRDRDDVFGICHKTGFFGEDASFYFKDAVLFGTIFVSYYIDNEPENAFVAVDDDHAVGYIVGTDDTLSQKESFDRAVMPDIIRRLFSSTIFRHPKDALFLLGLRGYEHFEEELYVENLLDDYPAHLHINLLAGYQRKGLGERLMLAFEDRMKQKRVPGIHLVTSTLNTKAVPFYDKMGYRLIKKLPNFLWDKKSPPGTQSLVYAKTL
ncbi:MAG: GNAT family N-acetyltransferase [Deltaproteobacteria bacterium]|nr:GNAT family N-acetyltransferase [Candidatus Zymogenaceae bacterium]